MTAAAAGKHVFCEKPMAITERECDEMAEAAERAGVVLQIGFMRRFQPEFVEARRRIEAGEIGDPMVIKSLTRGPGLPPPWAWDLKTSNGMLAEVNSHDFDCVRWLMGSEITRVYAEAANLKGADRGVDVEDFYDNAVVDAAVRLGRASARSTGRARPTTATTRASRSSARRACCRSARCAAQALLMVQDREVGAVSPVHRTWPERFEAGYRAQMRAFADGGARRAARRRSRRRTGAPPCTRCGPRTARGRRSRPIALDQVLV